MPLASTSSGPNFELLDIITTVPADVPALVVVLGLVVVVGLVFGAAAFDPDEPQAARPTRATGTTSNHAPRPDERR